MTTPGLLAIPLICGLAFVTAATSAADWQKLLDSARESVAPAAGGGGEVASGLKEALGQGARYAVDALGRDDGFLQNPQVRIGLPGGVDTLAKGLRAAGQGAQVDAFEASMNRAAEAAVPASLEVLEGTIGRMTIADAQGILQGGDTAATDYLRRTGGQDIEARMLPIVAKATDDVGVTRQYKQLLASAGTVGSLLGGNLDLDSYVTEQAVDGLFQMIAAEEKRIRTDPVARGSELLKKVFGG